MRVPPTQDQLLKRAMIISLTIGILLGILLTIVGLNLLARDIGVLFLADLLGARFSDAFFPCSLSILGATMALTVELSSVRRQLHALAQPAEGFPESLELLGRIFGIYLFVFGGILGIARIFSLAIPGLIWVVIFPGGFFFSLLLVAVLVGRHRRKTT